MMSNIAEGFERDGHAEFKQFLSIAKGSCGETRSLFYAALDADLIDEATFRRLVAQAEGTSKVITGLRSLVDGWQSQQRADTRRTVRAVASPAMPVPNSDLRPET